MEIIQPKIKLSNITKKFITKDKTTTALQNVSLEIQESEFVVIVGASGCGKTTLINHIAGFIEPDSGEVLLDNQPITGITPQCGMIFQQYALFPWMTVQKNIEFGPKMKGIPADERKKIAEKYIKLVDLQEFANSYPNALSGGMKQRVSIARVLANDPKVMLLDEPFAALDAMTRQVLQEQLVNIYEKNKKTIIFITHSIDEALLLSSRIVIMTARPGRIAKDIKNDLPHPRSSSIQLSPEYIELKRIIWSTVQEEVLKNIESQT